MFSEKQDYADVQEKDDFLEVESSLPGMQIPVIEVKAATPAGTAQ